RDLGRGDDTSVFFSPANAFYYLVERPGQALRLSRPAHYQLEGVVFDGRFPPEDGAPGRVPKATGNDVTSPSPSANDWYETIKLNWGRDFVTGATAYAPPSPVWRAFDDILATWQARGI